ncbi:MAG: SRPBCC family protein [Myxococcales bacterium]|nr:SRPBCC family protein [Myxococcales bacterium]MCB9717931.1 SRPBCC family protein [Myxococcales bacterium]
MAEGGVSVERRFAAPRELVWALLADSNRYDRALGLGVASYTWRTLDGQRVLQGRAKQGGLELAWVEQPYQWIEGRMLSSLRIFDKGPAKEGGLRVEVEDDGDGCIARLTAFGEPRSWILRVLEPLVLGHLRRQISRYMDSIARVLEPRDTAVDGGGAQPAVVRVQRLLGHADDAVASGGVTPADAAELRRRADRLSQAPVDAGVVKALVQTLERRPDEEVSQMRPFELARGWGLDRRPVLQAFLHATRAGLVDLQWQINCPVCRVSAQVVGALQDVGRDVHCEACNISYDIDFGANVEAVFRCNKAIRDVEPAVYCAASPAFRPHVLAQLRVQPGEVREETLRLHDGRVHLRTLERQRAADLHDLAVPARLEVELGPEAVTATAHGRSDDGTTTLVLRSALDAPGYLLVERGAWASDAVLGSILAAQSDFVDLFATEAPAAGLDLTIGNLTLLFSDLTGSTALYERIGDARAYAVVQEHFRLMEAAIARHEGAVVKTMGDAVMATFATPQQAVRAAIEAVREAEAQHGELGIGVKLGVHEGPCLAVRANDRLDFFGTTVNLAARLQGQAGTSELVLMRELAELPAVAELLRGAPQRAVIAHLKGISADQALVAFDLGPRASEPGSP